MLRLRPVLVALLLLVTRPLAAQDEPFRGAPARLERPAPTPSNSVSTFQLSLAATVRLSALSLGLSDLAQRERDRFWPGSLQLAFAVGAGVGAVFIDDPGLRSALTLASAIGAGRGIVQLSMRSNVAAAERSFSALEAGSKSALFLKLRVGERALAKAARVGKTRRILEGCLSMAGAAAYVPVQWAFAKQEDGAYHFGATAGDYVGLSLSLIAFASGLAQAIVDSPAERHYSAYRMLRRETMKLP